MVTGQSFDSFQKAEEKRRAGQWLARLRIDFPDAAPHRGSKHPILIVYDDDTAERRLIGFPYRISEGGATKPHIEIGRYHISPFDALPPDYEATKTIELWRIQRYLKLPAVDELKNMSKPVHSM